MTIETAKKYSYIVNTFILFLVFGLMAFFKIMDATFLVYFSIPTIAVYLIGYFLIWKKMLAAYVWMIYLWITVYMGVTTVCLGYGFGFHLYCMSMIPIVFVTEYMAYKLKRRSLKALYVSMGVCIVYLVSTGLVSNIGPIYKIDDSAAKIFWLMNSVIVFGFLIFYTNWMLRLVIESDKKLVELAHVDKLTGLFNRHYIMELLESKAGEDPDDIIAMADIDHFKKINDTYGHNAGDYCLKTLAELLKESCKNVTVGRWGGEEFLVYLPSNDKYTKKDDLQFFENIRKTVETKDFEFEGKHIKVTITIGAARKNDHVSIEKWIQEADENLYYGKNNGRNRVIGADNDNNIDNHKD